MILTSISYQSITFCVYEQECLFGEVVASLMRINDYGRIAQREWERLPARFKNIALEAFVVMPNHVHGIIVIADKSGGVGARQDISKTLAHNRPAVPLRDNPKNIEHFGRPVPGSIPTIVRSYKSAVSLRINRIRAISTEKIWQRNYSGGYRSAEHVIRSEADPSRLRAYIQANPARWAADPLHPDT
jgi:REP-associated tyrosine transposase